MQHFRKFKRNNSVIKILPNKSYIKNIIDQTLESVKNQQRNFTSCIEEE